MKISYYHQTVELWEQLCQTHFELYNKTCDEYQLLLESNFDELPTLLKEKEKLIEEVASLEKKRQELTSQINQAQAERKIVKIADLLQSMEQFEANGNKRYLFRYNKLLIDIIEKIQVQNKKNALFLNRAHQSLEDLKKSHLGKKNYTTYNAKGVTQKKQSQT